MKKYFYYLLLVAFMLITKVVGLVWYWVAVPFRSYARNIVHSYVLRSHINLKRLLERHPKITWIGSSAMHFELQDVHKVGRNGYISAQPVSTLKFWLVVFLLWGWVDDDANQDTFDAGHNRRYIDGDLSNTIMGRLFGNRLREANINSTYGNAFDLGDIRGWKPDFDFISALIWNTRNTAYNFNYLFQQTSDSSVVFMVKIFGRQFGWSDNGNVDGIPFYQLEFATK